MSLAEEIKKEIYEREILAKEKRDKEAEEIRLERILIQEAINDLIDNVNDDIMSLESLGYTVNQSYSKEPPSLTNKTWVITGSNFHLTVKTGVRDIKKTRGIRYDNGEYEDEWYVEKACIYVMEKDCVRSSIDNSREALDYIKKIILKGTV